MRKARTDAAEQRGPESLDAFLARIQAARLADGLVVTEAAHPDATDTLFDGAYSGFPLKKGAAFARYSDGSTDS